MDGLDGMAIIGRWYSKSTFIAKHFFTLLKLVIMEGTYVASLDTIFLSGASLLALKVWLHSIAVTVGFGWVTSTCFWCWRPLILSLSQKNINADWLLVLCSWHTINPAMAIRPVLAWAKKWWCFKKLYALQRHQHAQNQKLSHAGKTKKH